MRRLVTIAMLLTTLTHAADHVWKTVRVVAASTDKRFRRGGGTFSSRWVTQEGDEFSYVVRETLPPLAVGSVGMIVASPIVRLITDAVSSSTTASGSLIPRT